MANTHVSNRGAIKVALTRDEAARAAVRARSAFKRAGGRTKFEPGRGDDLATRYLEGECAKVAVDKWLGGNSGDVSVRYTAYGDDLIIAPSDAAGRYLRVRGRLPEYELIGWAYADDAPKRGVWRDDVPRPAWFIPASELRDPWELKVGW